jgi:hypothetical protein
MNAARWIRRQRDRQVAEHERHTAITAVVVLLGAAVLLTLTQPTSQTSSRALHSAQTTRPALVEHRTLALTPEADKVAERFLAGYLAYTYGQAHASRITSASRALILSLEAHSPRVPPAARARHPRVLSLHVAAAPTGEVVVRAVVNDGGLINYPVGLLLGSEHGRLLVTGLEGA